MPSLYLLLFLLSWFAWGVLLRHEYMGWDGERYVGPSWLAGFLVAVFQAFCFFMPFLPFQIGAWAIVLLGQYLFAAALYAEYQCQQRKP